MRQNPERLSQTRLRIKIHSEHAITVKTQVLRQVRSSGGLGHAPFEVTDRQDQRPLPFRSPRRNPKGALQLVNLLEGELATASADLRPLRELLVLLQPPI